MSVFAAAYGCASSSDDGKSDSNDLSAATGSSCRVAYEDSDIVVFKDPHGATSYAPKMLHVVDLKVTPASPNLPASLQNTRFAQGHVDYVLGGRAQPASLAKLKDLLGPGTQPAQFTLAPTSAALTATVGGQPTFSTPDNGATIIADLTDTGGTLLAAATKKANLTSAKATASVACGGGTMQVAMTSGQTMVFDIAQAKVLNPGVDLNAVDTFLSMSSQIKNGSFSAQTTQINSPDLVAKLTAFAATVDAKIVPIVSQYGVTMQRADVQAAVNETWQAYLDLAQMVLTATKATVNTADMQTLQADGSYTLAPGLPADAQALLATANTARTDVEKVMAETGTGWATQNLQ